MINLNPDDLKAKVRLAEEGQLSWLKVRQAAEAALKDDPNNFWGNAALQTACLEHSYAQRPWDPYLEAGVRANRTLRRIDQRDDYS